MGPRWFSKDNPATEEFLLQDLQDILQAPQPLVGVPSTTSVPDTPDLVPGEDSVVYNPLASSSYQIADEEDEGYRQLAAQHGTTHSSSTAHSSSSFYPRASPVMVLGTGTAVGVAGAAIAVAAGTIAAGPVGLIIGTKVGTAFAAGCLGASGIACHMLTMKTSSAASQGASAVQSSTEAQSLLQPATQVVELQ